MRKKVHGAVVTVAQELESLSALAKRWDGGDLTDLDMVALVKRISKKLDNACYCDSNACCTVHSKHDAPHKNCILR